MMTTTKRISKPVTLSCGCTRYYIVYPNLDEELWCPTHDEYVKVGIPEARRGRVYQDDFWTEPNKKGTRFRGGCAEKGCDYVTAGEYAFDNWFRLRDHMHKHYMREHTNFSTTLDIREATRYERNAEPPF